MNVGSLYGSQSQEQQAGSSLTTGSQDTTTKGTQAQLQQGTGANNQQNVYTPQQQQEQGAVGSAYQNFLNTGNLPGTFAAPPQVIDAYNANFQNSIAPELAAQYGAGSPQIGTQQTAGLGQLLSNTYQNQAGNFQNVLGGLSNVAYSAVGSNAQNSGTTATNTANNNTQNTGYGNANINSALLNLTSNPTQT